MSSVTRRNLLVGMGSGAVVALLAACSTTTTPAATPTGNGAAAAPLVLPQLIPDGPFDLSGVETPGAFGNNPMASAVPG